VRLFPAIDIQNGRCVRLRRGVFADETVFGEDPVEVAERWRGERRLLFLLNHIGEERQVALDREYANLPDGPDAPCVSRQVTLPRGGCWCWGRSPATEVAVCDREAG